MSGPNILARSDANRSLVVEVVAAGSTLGPARTIQNLSPTVGAANYLKVAEQTAGSLETRLTPFANVKLKCDENGSIQVAEKTAGSLVSPRRPLANTLVRTDENAYLLIAYVAAGTLGPKTHLLNVSACTDENGYLLLAEGP